MWINLLDDETRKARAYVTGISLQAIRNELLKSL
jgi:hypothetical protein